MSFRFKQFQVDDDACAMKVGTDGVLLGAWAPLRAGVRTVLDIGTGSGLIALMLAQRTAQAQIIGIDIDEAAVRQAQRNFCSSPWSGRIEAQWMPLQAFSNERKFDLIVSNPPFFQNSLPAPDAARNAARHTETLSFAELLSGVASLLAEDGIFAVVLPAEAEASFVEAASRCGLTLSRRCLVAGRDRKPPKRAMLAFGFQATSLTEDPLLVLQTDAGTRTPAYQHLTQEFYL